MTDFFRFEQDFVESLRCIPMQVRYKLDTCGIKLKLQQWNLFTLEDRERLVSNDVKDVAMIRAYRSILTELIQARSGEAPTELPVESLPAWLNDWQVPAVLMARTTDLGRELSIEQWQRLSPLQRFALIKLSQSSHEQNNFQPALAEFGLL
jgi:hypothetical protein